MAITKNRSINQIQILRSGYVQIQYIDEIYENGQVIGASYSRAVKHIKDNLTNEETKIKELSKIKADYPDKITVAGV